MASYEKQEWEDFPNETTPLSADRMLHIEDGIANAAVSDQVPLLIASEISNPESASNSAVETIVNDALATFEPSDSLTIVQHGTNPSYARPPVEGRVAWIGTVVPTNRISGDIVFIAEETPIVPVLRWSDDFNRANVTPLGTTSVGSKAWVESSAWQVIGNQAASTAASGVRYATVDDGLADGTLRAKLTAQGADHVGGIVFRYVDVNNQIVLAARVSASDFHYRIIKRVAGTLTQVAVLPNLSADGDELEVTMSGTTIMVKINGAIAWSGTITEHATATKHGLYHGSGSTNDQRMDDASFWTLAY